MSKDLGNFILCHQKVDKEPIYIRKNEIKFFCGDGEYSTVSVGNEIFSINESVEEIAEAMFGKDIEEYVEYFGKKIFKIEYKPENKIYIDKLLKEWNNRGGELLGPLV